MGTWDLTSSTKNMLHDWDFNVFLLVIVLLVIFIVGKVHNDRNHGQDEDDDGGDDDDEDESSGGNISVEVNGDDITSNGEGNLVESGVGRLGRFAGKFKRGMKRALGKIRSLVTPSCIGGFVVCALA